MVAAVHRGLYKMEVRRHIFSALLVLHQFFNDIVFATLLLSLIAVACLD
jgi:hypothetical protein